MIYVQQKLGITERRACRALGQSRGLQRRVRKRPEDEEALIAEMTALAVRYGLSLIHISEPTRPD